MTIYEQTTISGVLVRHGDRDRRHRCDL